jgi:hypothetical protein
MALPRAVHVPGDAHLETETFGRAFDGGAFLLGGLFDGWASQFCQSLGTETPWPAIGLCLRHGTHRRGSVAAPPDATAAPDCLRIGFAYVMPSSCRASCVCWANFRSLHAPDSRSIGRKPGYRPNCCQGSARWMSRPSKWRMLRVARVALRTLALPDHPGPNSRAAEEGFPLSCPVEAAPPEEPARGVAPVGASKEALGVAATVFPPVPEPAPEPEPLARARGRGGPGGGRGLVGRR